VSTLADVVEFLRRPDSYPEPVGAVEAIETHMSWVFLAGMHAYKLKKPGHRERMDYRTPAARRRACHAELRLNRRLAPAVYLGVVALLETRTGQLALRGEGTRIDWLVRMRRLPDSESLQAQLGAGALAPDAARRIVGRFAEYQRHAHRARWTALAYRRRLLGTIGLAARELVRPEFGLDERAIARVRDALRHFVASRAAWLDERVAAGRIVDGHGDLRPEHVYSTASGVLFVDCLEFDRDLRLRDPVDELAFLALECERLGRPDFGAELFEAWSASAGERVPPALLEFYQARNAFVRARIAAWHVGDPDCGPPEPWRARAREYLARALACMERAMDGSPPPRG
jgi:aminoglycoside phosphotransferase family enzyme